MILTQDYALKLTSIFGAAMVLLFLGAGCSFESSEFAGVQCDEDGAVDGDRICSDGFWAVQDNIDAGADIDDDIGCIGESDEELAELCADQECGILHTTDKCDRERSVDCGGCPDGEDCRPDDQVCSDCPQTNRQLCDSYGFECGIHTMEDECGGTREDIDCSLCATEPVETLLSAAPYTCCNDEGGRCTGCEDFEIITESCNPATYQCEEEIATETRFAAEDCANCQDNCTPQTSCEPPAENVCAQDSTWDVSCQARTCQEDVDDGNAACVDTAAPPVLTSEACDTGIDDGSSCEDVPFCPQTAGECQGQSCIPPCSGGNSDCGCDSCENCTDDDGWYSTGDNADCPDGWEGDDCFEIVERTHSCFEQDCTEQEGATQSNVVCNPVAGSQCQLDDSQPECSSQGLQNFECEIWTCDGSDKCESTTEILEFVCDDYDSNGDSCEPESDDGWADSGERAPCCRPGAGKRTYITDCPVEIRFSGGLCSDNECNPTPAEPLENRIDEENPAGGGEECETTGGSDDYCYLEEADDVMENVACCIPENTTGCD